MTVPATPSLTLTRLSTTSFRAAVTGDSGVTHRLFHRRVGTGDYTTGPTRVGDGNLDVTTGLVNSGQYLVWDVADNGTSLSLPAISSVSLVTSDTLLAVLKTKWYGSSTLLAACGKLYANEVPERDEQGNPVEVPYTYCEVSRTRFDWTTENLYYEMTDLEFNTFAAGAAAAELAQDQLREEFDWKPLPFTRAFSVRVDPVDDLLTSETLRYKDGSLIYRAQVCYSVVVERRLTNQP